LKQAQAAPDGNHAGPQGAYGLSGPPPPQGIYEGCSPGAVPDECVEHLEQISDAGFKYVVNYSAWYGTPQAVVEYAEAASRLGLQLIWPLNHQVWRGEGSLSENYSKLSESRAMSNPEFISLAVNLVKDLPATWGFYIGDELATDDVSETETLSGEVEALAPDKEQLYVARPGVQMLKPFLKISDVAGADVYPIGSRDPRVWRSARLTGEVTAEAGVGTAMVLQAFSWSQYNPRSAPAFPSREQMRSMRDEAVRCSDPSMILWYSYQDIERSDAPEKHWEDLVSAAFGPVTYSDCPKGA
jgi:hypothetical protein